MNSLSLACLTLCLVSAALTAETTAPMGAPAAAAAPLSWIDITNDLATSASPGGVHVVAVDPTSGGLVAGVTGGWLWESGDAGATWSPLAAVPNPKNRPSCIVFDPLNAGTFWTASDSGAPTLFVTTDHGKTFKALGGLQTIANLGVDLSPAKKRLMVAGMYQQNRLLQVSENGGQYFAKNYKIPASIGYTQYVAVLDATTILVSSSGADDKDHKTHENGIWLSPDAGRTWSKVNEMPGNAPTLIGSDGSVYWPLADKQGILVSHDHGKTWGTLTGVAKFAPMDLGKGWLAAGGDSQLEISTDKGASWDVVGPKLPFDADGIVYVAQHHCFVAWHDTGSAGKNAVMRLDVPTELELLVNPTVPRDLVLWDGDDKKTGTGWTPQGSATIGSESAVVRQGGNALQWHVDAKSFFINAGWIWMTYPLTDAQASDGSGYTNVVLSLKLDGTAKPTILTLAMNGLANGQSQTSKAVNLLTFAPKVLDGKWHDVMIPLASFADIDVKKLSGITLTANNGSNAFTFDLYLDNIGLSK